MDDNATANKARQRIAKVIARAGLASRREAELWIAAGRVAVNGNVIASPACNVTAVDRVTVDGEPLPARERTRLFLYHKPRGLMTTHADPQGRPTIFQRLPPGLPRLISVGRLDFTTEGLLLLTNDGELARVLELPATGWLRRYRVRAHGSVTQAQLDALREGVTISGIHYGAIDAALERVQGSNLWLSFAIREGKNREVRTVLGHLDLDVTRLIRVSFGPFQLGELADGAVEEVRTRVLREQLGARLVAQAAVDFSAPVAAAPPPRQQRDAPPDNAPAPRRQRHPARDDARKHTTRRDDARKHSNPTRDDTRKRSNPTRDDAGKRTSPTRDDTRKRTSATPQSHSWRAREEERPGKPLRRKFHGPRRKDDDAQQTPADERRAGLLTDRKGRRVLVERHGQPPPKQQREEPPSKHRFKSGSRRVSDRAAGPRPHQPRPRGRR